MLELTLCTLVVKLKEPWMQKWLEASQGEQLSSVLFDCNHHQWPIKKRHLVKYNFEMVFEACTCFPTITRSNFSSAASLANILEMWSGCRVSYSGPATSTWIALSAPIASAVLSVSCSTKKKNNVQILTQPTAKSLLPKYVTQRWKQCHICLPGIEVAHKRKQQFL